MFRAYFVLKNLRHQTIDANPDARIDLAHRNRLGQIVLDPGQHRMRLPVQLARVRQELVAVDLILWTESQLASSLLLVLFVQVLRLVIGIRSEIGLGHF